MTFVLSGVFKQEQADISLLKVLKILNDKKCSHQNDKRHQKDFKIHSFQELQPHHRVGEGWSGQAWNHHQSLNCYFPQELFKCVVFKWFQVDDGFRF